MDASTTWTLTSRESWDLLERSDIGRLATCLDGRPDVFPVNYVVANGTVIFRTDPGIKHVAVRREHHVAFEVDGIDTEEHMAWSVVIKGRASDITNEQELERVSALPLRPLQEGDKSIFVRIEPLAVTGRRFPLA